MKKLFAMLIAAVMVLSFAACAAPAPATLCARPGKKRGKPAFQRGRYMI